jgi:hypothetical protein
MYSEKKNPARGVGSYSVPSFPAAEHYFESSVLFAESDGEKL